MKYLHLSIFDGHTKRHGGTRRSEQVRELLDQMEGAEGISINPYLKEMSALRLAAHHPLLFLRALWFSVRLYFTRGLSFLGFLQYAACSVNLLKALEDHAFDIVIHETAPGISISFMKYLSSRGIPYIAIPHNIEFMVPGQVLRAFRNRHRLYQTEIEGYCSAQQVLAICDFDTAILRCNGVNARTLVYRPTRSDRTIFERIRIARAGRSEFDGLLLLGTVENVPSFNGVKALLEILRSTHPKFRLTVAGYGTEAFSNYQSDVIKVLGSVSQAEAERLLLNATALVINQPQTTGFLTKIVETNLCGVPQIIIGDYFQAEGLDRYGIIRTKIDALHEVSIPSSFEIFTESSSENALAHSVNARKEN
jgi:glycosyltransferase involved in cell wall biosynthesis